MNTIAKTLLLVAFLASVFSSCQVASLESTEEIKAMVPPTLQEFEQFYHNNTQKKWLCQSFTLAGLDGLQGCRLDDTMTILSDGTYTYDGGTNLCGAEDSQRIKTGNWKILNNGVNIIFDEGSPTAYTVNVIILESQKIVLRGTYFGLEINGTYRAN
jgi:hypothetical protein